MSAALPIDPPAGSTRVPAARPSGSLPWSTEDAAETYLIDRWGGGYFGVSDDGKMTVTPLPGRPGSVAILDVVEAAIRDEGLKAPLIIRFQDMLHHRVRVLNEAFAKAIQENKFRGSYRGVFPIKVNQLREVVEEIIEAGRPWHYGIEVGSKPEMFAGLALHTDTTRSCAAPVTPSSTSTWAVASPSTTTARAPPATAR